MEEEERKRKEEEAMPRDLKQLHKYGEVTFNAAAFFLAMNAAAFTSSFLAR